MSAQQGQPAENKFSAPLIQATTQSLPDVNMTSDPEFSIREIIEYRSRMRLSGMEKFNSPCYIAHIYIYESEETKTAKEVFGNFAVFVETEIAFKLFKTIGYGVKDEDDTGEMMDATGRLTQTIWDNLKQKLTALGYRSFVLGEVKLYQNDVPDGVDFRYSEREYYEAAFTLWKNKAVVVDLNLPQP